MLVLSDSSLLELHAEKVEEYLSCVYKSQVKVLQMSPLRGSETADLKGFGYGVPCLIQCEVEGQAKQLVLETMKPEGFGHDYFSDRAGILLWQHSVFNKLDRHVRSVDVGSFLTDGQTLRALGDCVEFFLLTEFVNGELYHMDLDRIKHTGHVTDRDEERCVALSNYLVGIHSLKKDDPSLYTRAIRDLIGHGECIFGLTDSYPPKLDYVDEKFFIRFEKNCIDWRWRLKHLGHRLSQVHGDFHPWNILFKEGVDFTVLDRSREEWGEPADDVAAITINYIFYSLQTFGKMNGPFGRLFVLFWKNYLDESGDDEILKVVQPFYAWRSIVLASPLWYPKLSPNVRRKLFRFARTMLETKDLEYERVESYLN
jgi:hypothetical protein